MACKPIAVKLKVIKIKNKITKIFIRGTYESPLSKRALKTAGENLAYILTYGIYKTATECETDSGIYICTYTKIALIYFSKIF